MTPNFSEWDDPSFYQYITRADVQKALKATPRDVVMGSLLVAELRRRSDQNPLWFVHLALQSPDTSPGAEFRAAIREHLAGKQLDCERTA